MNRDAIRDLVAGLAGGASSLGANINRRKERREDDERREKGETRAEERAMRMLVAKPTKEDTQVVTGEDENGPGIFLVDKQSGTKKRITDEAMSQLTGAPPTPTPLLRKPGASVPETAPQVPAPAIPAGTEVDEEHGSTGDPMLPPDSPIRPTVRKLGLQPIPKVDKPPTEPRRMPRSVMVDGKPMEVTMDGVGNAYDLAGNKVAGQITPYAAEKAVPLVTAVGPDGKQVRAIDKPGVEVPGPSNTGAAAMRTKIAENRSRMRDIDNALMEYNKHPESTGGLLRDIADVVPMTATAISKYDQNKNPSVVTAQSAIGKLGAMIVHDLSGAAVTVSEFPRLAVFLPLKGDKPEVVRIKLKNLRDGIQRLNEEIEKMAGQNPESPKAPPAGDPEFEALMNKYAKKPPT